LVEASATGDPSNPKMNAPFTPSSGGWISIDERQPADGRKVEVKTLLGIERTATRAVPAMHWRYPDVSRDFFRTGVRWALSRSLNANLG
jgi:hypothetical protein